MGHILEVDVARWDSLKSLRELHALHGFPSGPITIPGGSFCSFPVSFVMLGGR
jgi:hypothetical protein